MRTASVVIIGGGVMGLSTAYHLARRGCTDVVLLEKSHLLGSGATGQNAGGIRHQFSTPINVELSRLSISMFENFADVMDQDINLNFCGYMFLLDNEDDLDRFRSAVQIQRQAGISTELLSSEEVALRVPELNMESIVGGSFNKKDGLVDPWSVVQGYALQARRLGIRIETGWGVSGFKIGRNKMLGVKSEGELISTERVVVAAGPWSGLIGKLAGISLPVQPLRRQLLITRPLDGISPMFPFVVDFSQSLYFHYEGGGVLTGMSNPKETPGFCTDVDEDWRLFHLERAIHRLPLLSEAELATEWAGLYEVTPDSQPILGSTPEVDGLYSCTGFSGHGFMQSPVCGLLMAEEILDGRAHTVNIDPLRIGRFESGKDYSEYSVI